MSNRWVAAGIAVFVVGASSAVADVPGRHPHYLHALADLRAAAWMLEHRSGEPDVRESEGFALREIHATYDEIIHASITDGKDIEDHTGVDVPPEHRGRLHKAAELLRGVVRDLDAAEDDPETRGLKHRARDHAIEALHATERAVHDAELHQ